MNFDNNTVADPYGIVVKEEIGTAEEAGRKLFVFQFIIFIAILGLWRSGFELCKKYQLFYFKINSEFFRTKSF